MSEDEYSSLSDIDSDVDYGDDFSMAGPADSDYETTTKSRSRRGRPKKDKDKDGGYTIKNALKPPRATTYTAQALFDQIVSGDIDLDPEYQRDVVWPEAKQVGLIDSIFRNFYIPPVIFSVNAHEDGSESKICIDGKQRLTSIYRFMLGLIYHRDRISGERYWFKDSPTPETGKKKKRNILPEKYRRLFANKQIVCVEYADINDKDEREIFQRVQLGMALTPAEKLGVLKTARADFIRYLQSKFFKDDTHGLGSLDWDRSRGTDFRCLATILWCIDRYTSHPSNLSNTGSIVQLESFLSDTKPLDPTFRDRVVKTFEVFEEMVVSEDKAISGAFRMTAKEFGNHNLSGAAATGVTKVSPIEFICMSLLVLVWRERMGVRAMAKAIREMRREVRREHVDIRLNTKVGKTMIGFLKNIKVEDYETDEEGGRGMKGKGKGKAGESGSTAGKAKAKTNEASMKVGSKRKRPLEDDGAPATPASTSVSETSEHAMDTTDHTQPPKSKSTKIRNGTVASTSPASPPPSSAASGNTTPTAGQVQGDGKAGTGASVSVNRTKLASLRAVKQQYQAQTQSPRLTQSPNLGWGEGMMDGGGGGGGGGGGTPG